MEQKQYDRNSQSLAPGFLHERNWYSFLFINYLYLMSDRNRHRLEINSERNLHNTVRIKGIKVNDAQDTTN